MAQTYSQLQAQIVRLQVEAETLRKGELSEVVARIRGAIAAYGILPEDLFGKSEKLPVVKPRVASFPSASKSKSSGAQSSKFADGKGNTWVGRGPRPHWLRDALAAGKSLSDFAVDASRSSAETTSATSKTAEKAAGTAKFKSTKKPVAAKYKDEAGNSWTGRGSQPKWLRLAVAAGKTADQFLV